MATNELLTEIIKFNLLNSNSNQTKHTNIYDNLTFIVVIFILMYFTYMTHKTHTTHTPLTESFLSNPYNQSHSVYSKNQQLIPVNNRFDFERLY
jgi:hypothetical protein